MAIRRLRAPRAEWAAVGACCGVLGLLFVVAGPVAAEDPAATVVAKIGQERVYLSEVLERITAGPPSAPHGAHDGVSGPPPKQGTVSVDAAIEQIVRIRLLLREAEAAKIPRPTEEEFRRVFSTSAMTLPNLASASFQTDWMAAALSQRLVEKLVEDVSASDREIAALFHELRNGFQPDAAQLRWIVVDAQPEAEAVLKRLAAHEDFGAVARQVSLEKNSAEGGGMVGAVVPAKIHEEVARVVFAPKSKPGLIPHPIQVTTPIPYYGPAGWYVVFVDQIVRAGDTDPKVWKPVLAAKIKREKAERVLEARLQARRARSNVWISDQLHELISTR